jgi:hypothetical protein
MASTEIATVDSGAYLALNHDPSELREILQANLGATELTERNLPRVKVPTGGGTTWSIPGPFGDEMSKDLTGVLVYFKRTRAYWTSKKLSGEPPACVSEDGIRGIGSPGGACRACPMNVFGSAAKLAGADAGAKGKACKEREVWFLLRAGGFLPVVLSLPSMSLRDAEGYRINLSSGGVPLEAVETTVTLRQETGADGPFAIAVPKFSAQLSPDDRARARAYAADMRPQFEAVVAAMATETPESAGPVRGGADDLDAEPGA